ncbi:MAG: hypothetical protein LW817_00060, partial [Candidatus Caenarcaniphilales bacterium]|nr:hypothetical protein [Candidatus Caenarcaniphilales bacterium]
REGTAPSATANFGKVFVNSANSRLYFQDDAGVNYNLTNGATAVVPGGSDTQFQFNDGGSFGGNGALSFTKASRTLAVAANAPLDINSTTVSIADNNIDFDSGSGVTFTPTAGQSLNVDVSGAGDFAVNGTTLYVDSSARNVGIGTTSPTSALDVNGRIRIRGGNPQTNYVLTANASNGSSQWRDITYILNNGGAFLNALNDAISDRTSNLFLGNGAGLDATGVNNTGVGIHALNTMRIGNGNTAFGFSALKQLTNGSNNVAIGDRAGIGMTAGNGNIFIGNVNGSSATASNELNIADSIFGNLSTGNIGIGTQSPANFKLELAGNLGPSTDDTRNIGSATRRFSNAYLKNVFSTQVNGSTANLTTVNSTDINSTTVNGGTFDGDFTNGSLLFSNAAGVISQNNSQLFWDRTNNRLGVGTNTPVRAKARINIGSAAEQGLVLQAAAGQTGNLTEWRNNAGTALSVVTSAGNVGINQTTASYPLSVTGNTDFSALGPLYARSSGGTNVGTGLTLDASDNVGGKRWSFISTGTGAGPGAGSFSVYNSTDGRYEWLTLPSGRTQFGVNFFTDLGARVAVQPESASTRGLIVRSTASQTANLTEWQSNGGIIRSLIDNGGRMAINRPTRRTGSALDVNGTIFTTGLLVNGTNPTFSIREGTAPTATANFGKMFVNSTNSRLYFQDDAGVNYNLTNGATAINNVTATSNITDNVLVRGDGGAKGIQGSGITIDDTDNITGVTSIAAGTVNGVTFDGDFTNGSVLFSNAAGVISQNNSQLFWDRTNNRLGIGVNAPNSILDITGTSATVERILLRNTGSGSSGLGLWSAASADSFIDFYPSSSSARFASGVDGSSGEYKLSYNNAGSSLPFGTNDIYKVSNLGASKFKNLSASAITLSINGSPSQTANLTEWQSNGAVVRSLVDNGGRMAINRATRRAGSVLDVNGTIFSTGLLVNGTNPTFSIREGTAPTATANFGKMFVNSTNSRLYFQDDAGVNYNLTNGATTVVPGGSNTQFQFNDGGSFAGNGALSFTKASRTLAVAANAPLDINSTSVSIADNNISFDSGTGVTFTPTAGQSLNVDVSGAGDFAVNGSTLYVDSSARRTGLLTNAPTHSLTLGSTHTGISLYTTADQTTNFGRAVFNTTTSGAPIAVYDIQNGGTVGTGYHRFSVDGTTKLEIDNNQSIFYQSILSSPDNTNDIGRLSASPMRFRDFYLARGLQV